MNSKQLFHVTFKFTIDEYLKTFKFDSTFNSVKSFMRLLKASRSVIQTNQFSVSGLYK